MSVVSGPRLRRLVLWAWVGVFLSLLVGPAAGGMAVQWWQTRPAPPPLRYPDVGRIGRVIDPAETSVPRVERGQELLVTWKYCNDTGAPLPATAIRAMRSTAGHIVPLPEGQITFPPGCTTRETRSAGYTDELAPGLLWHLEAVATVRVGGRVWDVPYRTEDFLVLPPQGGGS